MQLKVLYNEEIACTKKKRHQINIKTVVVVSLCAFCPSGSATLEHYKAAMLLSGVGDALGYRNQLWEYNESGPAIHQVSARPTSGGPRWDFQEPKTMMRTYMLHLQAEPYHLHIFQLYTESFFVEIEIVIKLTCY